MSLLLCHRKYVTNITSQDFSIMGTSQSKFMATPVPHNMSLLLLLIFLFSF